MPLAPVTGSVVDDVRRGHRGLYLFTLAMAMLAVALVVAAIVDRRTLLGAPIWFKPLKFALSFMLYTGALSWLLMRLPRVGRGVRTGVRAVILASVIEMVIIVGQAARGQQSHFNESDTLGIVAYGVMGGTIAVLYIAAIGISVAVLRQPGPDRVVTFAVKAGLVVALLGFAVGVAMVLQNAHAVGVADGGPGLPLVGWSTTGGDLRIGHFIGMHALQLIPLAAAAVTVCGRGRWAEQTQIRLVGVFVAGYTAVVVLLTWQAWRGQLLTSPDALTFGGLAVILAATTTGSVIALRGRRNASPTDGAHPGSGR